MTYLTGLKNALGDEVLVNLAPGDVFMITWADHNSVFNLKPIDVSLYMMLWCYEHSETQAQVGIMNFVTGEVVHGNPQMTSVKLISK